VAQVVEHLLCKCEALSSNTNHTERKKERKKERKQERKKERKKKECICF
jgi:hypothetical protein